MDTEHWYLGLVVVGQHGNVKLGAGLIEAVASPIIVRQSYVLGP